MPHVPRPYLRPLTRVVAALAAASSSCVAAPAFACALAAGVLAAGALLAAPAARAQEQSRGMRVQRAGEQSVESLVEAGDRLADAGRWEEAVKVYRLATEVEPKSAEARLRLAEALMSAGRWDEALDSYRRAVALDGRNPEAHYALGRAFNDMGQHGDAFKPLVRAVQLDPSFAEAHHGIGWAYLRTDQYDKSLPFLRGALRLKPDYDEALYALALAHYRLGQRAAADEQRRQLAAVSPSLLKELDAEVARLVRDAAPAPGGQPAAVADRRAQPSPSARAADAPGAAAAKSRRSASRRRGADPSAASQAVSQPVSQPASQPARAPESAAFELTFWETIKDSTDPEDFRDYLRRYPDGVFADLARRRAGTRPAETSARGPHSAPQRPADDATPRAADGVAQATAPQDATARDASRQDAPTRSTLAPNRSAQNSAAPTSAAGTAVAPSAVAPSAATSRPPAEANDDAETHRPAETHRAANSDAGASREADEAEPPVSEPEPPAGAAAQATEAPQAAAAQPSPAQAAPGQPSPAQPSQPTYDDLMTRAEEAWAVRDADEAARLLSVAAALAPARVEAYQMLGVVELYGRQDLTAAARAMRAALERGGTAAFAVTHDHDGSFSSYCQGSFYVTRGGVSYQSGDGTHAFQAPAADIREARPQGARGDLSAFFHLRLKGSGGSAENHYFAPGTSKAEETALILSLIPKP
ncbi:MAG TPA: tetratricopeptide repeat protein [Pyrinomonadaceae bacterium]|nr:tetratricopeptide repeat protein [Pyrinomonadaceae bacterium]